MLLKFNAMAANGNFIAILVIVITHIILIWLYYICIMFGYIRLVEMKLNLGEAGISSKNVDELG